MPFPNVLSPNDAMAFALDIVVGMDREWQNSLSQDFLVTVFHAHFGSSPLVVADMWYDLQVGEYEGASLSSRNENSVSGYRMFLMAMFYLWAKPKNSHLLASRFAICERYARGAPLWHWIRKIAALAQKKIKWDESLSQPLSERFVASVDCVDCQYQEPQHPVYNIDRAYFSTKFGRAGLKYEIVLSINHEQCMSINGPFKAGKPDMAVFRTKTKQLLKAIREESGQAKMMIGDSKYRKGPDFADEEGLLAPPSSSDFPVLAKFKSRVRCRHETFNGRIKNFSFLSNRFKGSEALHGIAMRAICVIVQYQMDNGSPIFCAK